MHVERLRARATFSPSVPQIPPFFRPESTKPIVAIVPKWFSQPKSSIYIIGALGRNQRGFAHVGRLRKGPPPLLSASTDASFRNQARILRIEWGVPTAGLRQTCRSSWVVAVDYDRRNQEADVDSVLVSVKRAGLVPCLGSSTRHLDSIH